MKTLIKRFVKPLLPIIAKGYQTAFYQRASFPIAFWYEENLCEPSVQLAIRDLVKPGDIVFDVGANSGALSLLMSRLVGPRGIVCAFEASSRIVDKCQFNLVNNGCSNVTLYHKAVFHTSKIILPIYHGSHLNDSLLLANDHGFGCNTTETLAIDDFVETMRLTPTLLKFDIEGAEYDALQGAKNLITNVHPHLILEQQTNDSRCYDYLLSQGYLAIDLATYQTLETYANFPSGTILTNIAYVHRDRLAATPYQPPFKISRTAEIPLSFFTQAPKGTLNLTNPLFLGEGRYLVHYDHTAEGTKNEVMLGVEANQKPIARYHAYSKLLADNYRWLPINLPRPTEVNIYYRFLNKTFDPTYIFRKIDVYKVDNIKKAWNHVT